MNGPREIGGYGTALLDHEQIHGKSQTRPHIRR
jgi:hypothetical protein